MKLYPVTLSATCKWSLKGLWHYIPYSGKLSREKTFANFADLGPFAKVFFANIACARNQYPVYIRICESFLREIFMLVDSRNFSPSKLSHYTVNSGLVC